jgi:hypothetical protein
MRNVKNIRNCEGWPTNKAEHQAVQQPKIESEKGKQAERVVRLRNSSLSKHDNIATCISGYRRDSDW